ncbi:dihydrofolate reductase family protein [Bacillus chungangensis]|uniref:Dihydrofolate reductase n=1 Tax=Bacillus chungangensis TaxID=587633 RepID=A0ABT9WNY1_9BACI|nr:dihydrofolate reductase family protein [Bacillus chungangensis]MDQ0174984.1 dihydrofolate reductase [Bacillus chungangensis]
MSRKVVLYIAISMDGYIADEHGNINWIERHVETLEEDYHYETFFSKIDTVILGRKTYDQIVNELSPNAYPYKGTKSYVLTSKKEENQEEIAFVNEDVIELVSKLKKETGKDIWIVGGSQIAMSLVKENMIDEYQIAIIPVLLGKGIPLFTPFNKEIGLRLKSVDAKNGIIYTKYTNHH